MADRLNGKVAVITGGGAGIGREIALHMAAEDARIVINDINQDDADKVIEEIKKAGGQAAANYDNVATMSGGEHIIKAAISAFGRIDILVMCAGNFKTQKTLDMTEADWDSIISVHLKGHFSCTKAAITEMVKQKSGRIITISSRAACWGHSNLAYGAAKAGILGLTSALAEEMSEYGITVNSILPSASTQLFPGGRVAMGDNLPLSQNLQPEYVAPMAVYLATDEAKNVTGKYIYASGGDICIYGKPLKLAGESSVLVRKPGKWTLDELSQIIPPLVRNG